MAVIGSAKLLQALARDNLLPGFSIFSQGTKTHDEPTYAIVVTHVIGQLTMLCDVNQIATLITMSYLMCFVTLNVACFLLAISSAPNLRPPFRYFNWGTAGFGALFSGATMVFDDGGNGHFGFQLRLVKYISWAPSRYHWLDMSNLYL